MWASTAAQMSRWQSRCRPCARSLQHTICLQSALTRPQTTRLWETAIVELRQLSAIAARYNVTLCLETHVNCLTEIPEVAVRLVEAAPNLGIALDPSHFYAGPWQGRDFSTAYPHTRIVHLRDAGNSQDRLHMPPGKGRVDFAGLLAGLVQQGYAGPLSVEYIDIAYSEDTYDNHVQQVKAMAGLAKSLLARLDVQIL